MTTDKPYEVTLTDNSALPTISTVSDGYEFIISNDLYEFVISEPPHVVSSSVFSLDFSDADNSMYLALLGGVM